MGKTKEYLLKIMARGNACHGATEWVKGEDGTMADIVNACDRVDWLAWLLAHIRPRAAADVARLSVERVAQQDACEIELFHARYHAERSHSLADEDCPPYTSVPEALYRALESVRGTQFGDVEADKQLSDLRAAIMDMA